MDYTSRYVFVTITIKILSKLSNLGLTTTIKEEQMYRALISLNYGLINDDKAEIYIIHSFA